MCCNPSLEFATKSRDYKVVGQEWGMGITFHAPKSVGECEGMNLHTPKWAPTLGIGVLLNSQIFKGKFQGVKTHWIDKKIISLETSWNVDI
jgi:hypothetical protein